MTPAALILPLHCRQALINDARAAAPDEACGLLIGQGQQITGILPLTNAADDPRIAFEIKPSTLLQALKQIDQNGDDLIGIYHSHPATPPIPSERDKWQAWKQTSSMIHIIISLKEDKPRLSAWSMPPGEAIRVPLIAKAAGGQDDRPLNREQQTAIIVSGIAALVLTLVIALTLLPPAPPLT